MYVSVRDQLSKIESNLSNKAPEHVPRGGKNLIIYLFVWGWPQLSVDLLLSPQVQLQR